MRFLTYTVTLAVEDNRETEVRVTTIRNRAVYSDSMGGHLGSDLGRVIGQALIQSARAVLDKEGK